MKTKKESLYAQRKRRKAELEALSDEELMAELNKYTSMRRTALKMAVGWLRGVIG